MMERECGFVTVGPININLQSPAVSVQGGEQSKCYKRTVKFVNARE